MKHMKKGYFIYSISFFIILLVPLLAMPFYKNRSVTEKRILSPLPRLIAEGNWNQNYLSELGEYFSDRFAFRTEMVQVNAVIDSAVMRTSSEDKVILGKDGYLFYTDSVDFYRGKEIMDKRDRFATIRTLQLIQEYAASQGAEFLFMIAPNKNTLYPEYMPDNYQKIDAIAEIDRIQTELIKAGVNYLDLKAVFQEEEEVLYHRLDSHWNNKGAALAAEKIFAKLGQIAPDYHTMPYHEEEDFTGDLYGMLYPLGKKKDRNLYYDKTFRYQYISDFKSVEDITIRTTNADKEKTAVIIRDSFGNSLLPFLAEEYQEACFMRASPYKLDMIADIQADIVMFEIVERHLDKIAADAPVMPAPLRKFDEWKQEECNTGQTMNTMADERYLKITGNLLKNSFDTASEIYVRLIAGEDTKVYEATPLNDAEAERCGYGLYIPLEDLKNTTYIIELLTQKDGVWITSGYIDKFTKG